MLVTIKQAFEFIKYTLPDTCAYVSQAVEDEQTFELHACYGFDDNSKLCGSKMIKGYQAASMDMMPHDEVIFNESDNELRELVSQFTYDLQIKSGVIVPIAHNYGQWGMLAVFSETEHGFKQKDIDFIRAMAQIISSIIQNYQEPNPAFKQAKNIAIAKKHWEIAIDSLPQLVIGLNNEGKIIRVNRTIEKWGMGKVNEVKGLNISDLVKPICSDTENFLISNWEQVWEQVHRNGLIEQKVKQNHSGRTFQITLREVTDNEYLSNGDSCCAVVVIDDISTRQSVENYLKEQALELENKVNERTRTLKEENIRLKHALQIQKRANEALKKLQEGDHKYMHEEMHTDKKNKYEIM